MYLRTDSRTFFNCQHFDPARCWFRFGGGPAVNHLYLCTTCQGELERLKCRQKYEMDKFVQVGQRYIGQQLVLGRCPVSWIEITITSVTSLQANQPIGVIKVQP